MRRVLLVATLFFLACCTASAATLKQYDNALSVIEDRLTDTIAALDNGDDISVEKHPGVLAQQLLTGMDRVTEPDGAVIFVYTAGLINALKAADAIKSQDDQEAAYTKISERIVYLRSEIRGETSRTREPSKARVLARAILSDSKYGCDPVPPPTWMERQEKKMGAWVDRILSKLFGRRVRNTGPLPGWWKYVLYVIAGLFLATLIALIVYLIVRLVGRREASVALRPLNYNEESFVEARDTDSILSLAEKHAKSGDYRAAFRLVYIATLVSLDTNGVLRFDRSKTNWEYLRGLRRGGRQDLYRALTPLTRDFDRVWYGQRQAGPEEYRKAVEEYQRLTGSLAEPAVAGSKK